LKIPIIVIVMCNPVITAVMFCVLVVSDLFGVFLCGVERKLSGFVTRRSRVRKTDVASPIQCNETRVFNGYDVSTVQRGIDETKGKLKGFYRKN
jgi:hypothetical protein